MYHTFIFDPLYNGLISLINIFPWMDAGVAVIVFTIIVKLILFPLSKKAITTQVRMKELEPELNKIREQYKNDRQAQGLKTMELYRAKGVNPFSSFAQLLIQLPILWALYHIFMSSGLPKINHEYLYSFISEPVINMHFLGLVDVSMPSIILALVAAVTQYLQLHFSISTMPAKNSGDAKKAEPSATDIAQNMTRQMKYIFPVIIFIIAYKIAAVIAIYWAVSNLFTLGQELVVRHHIAKQAAKQKTA